MRIRVSPTVGALVAGLLLTLGLATPAAAAGTDYAALGDSYSSGVGTNNYDGTSGSCLRSPQAYPRLWVNSHTVSTFQFVACSGATTREVLGNQLGALNSGTDLVTISIGGNDAGFADVVTTCRLGTDSGCLSAVNNAKSYITGTLPGRLDETYRAIRSRAPYARVVVLGYPRLFELGYCGFGSINEYKRGLLNGGSDTISSVISARAAAAGFSYADVRGRFAGHGVCAATPWINGTTFPVVESYHPKAAGHSSAYLPALTAVTG
ncbi:SGNH/GDSL hydrolase family protein [Micromonospora mirobrigensis]|uniref:GDSL-like Lipase/Acylhydrolase family protein n=1 Tax=Micromonospora mirobrigensis TaxID=262898 RepID=A0A1C4Z6Z7_9ACTN|nr:SGNH/GDSL hydrolase family protein [Micromonospora mirobrigensis]SCF28769.1 GDSL-like Lipase/Acylhydrolase family protein [Micromonospora mirobrigensis]